MKLLIVCLSMLVPLVATASLSVASAKTQTSLQKPPDPILTWSRRALRAVLHRDAAVKAVIARPVVTTHPAVARLNENAYVVVRGVDLAALEVRLEGATDSLGRPLPWKPLRLRAGAWTGVLPRPALRGAYPIELRTHGEARVLRSEHWLFRVFATGTLGRPAFGTPELVARWWVSTIAHGRLVALKRWPRSAFDQRVVQLNRLLVVAYSRPGMPRVGDRLGIWITAVRTSYGGDWRLLEATTAP